MSKNSIFRALLLFNSLFPLRAMAVIPKKSNLTPFLINVITVLCFCIYCLEASFLKNAGLSFNSTAIAVA